MPSKLADRTDDARGDESFGLTEPGDLAEHRLRDRDGFVWLSSAFVEVVAGRQSLKGGPASARISSARPAGNRRLRIACENCSLWPFLRRPALIRSGFSSGARSA